MSRWLKVMRLGMQAPASSLGVLKNLSHSREGVALRGIVQLNSPLRSPIGCGPEAR